MIFAADLWILLGIFTLCSETGCQNFEDSSTGLRMRPLKCNEKNKSENVFINSGEKISSNLLLSFLNLSKYPPKNFSKDEISGFKDVSHQIGSVNDLIVQKNAFQTALNGTKFWSRIIRSASGRKNPRSSHHQTSGRVSLSGSSSSPVEPIKPLLNLGSSSSGGLTLPPHPVFDEAAPRNVSGLQENTAYLHCLVHNLGNKSVSWIRQRDLHILTVDRYTYTTDQRYEVIHSEGSKDWILKIKYAQVRDSGKYECQVSTKPVRSYIVNLNIYAPKAEIIGAPDMHVDRGSTINLTCVIEHSPHPPAYIFWYQNGKVINYDSPRGGITVVTERGNTTRGYLLIQDARSTDSGNYSCEPSNTGITSLRVHVLDGEFPAAMQTSSVKGLESQLPSGNVICFLAFILKFLYKVVLEERSKT